MNIQPGMGLYGYQGVVKSGGSQLSGVTARTASDGQSARSAASGSTEQVTISDAAKALANSDGRVGQERTALQQRLLASASADPQAAEKMAHDFANVPSQIAFDISDQLASGTSGPVNKLALSGRIIDDAFKENFSKEAAVIDSQMKAIYETEKAKGTPASEILAKMIDFTNAQSRDYREATGWLGTTSA